MYYLSYKILRSVFYIFSIITFENRFKSKSQPNIGKRDFFRFYFYILFLDISEQETCTILV